MLTAECPNVMELTDLEMDPPELETATDHTNTTSPPTPLIPLEEENSEQLEIDLAPTQITHHGITSTDHAKLSEKLLRSIVFKTL